MTRSSPTLPVATASRLRPARLFAGFAAMAAVLPAPALASSCSAEIDRLQALVDARIEDTARSGPAARESSAATEHRQPTPGSIARVEADLGEGRGDEAVLAALARARDADRAGDAAGCARAVEAARGALGR